VDAETLNGEEQLAQLRKEERSLSVRRTRLHNRLDFLRAGGYPGQSNETIADLERQEQEISRQRHEVHERIELAEARMARRSA
jgi:type III secretory pathway lipoprotein EscJ